MEKWEEVWAKQFGSKIFSAVDFSGEPIQRDFYKKYDSPVSWDVYYIEGKECISVSSKIFRQMPDHWEDIFFIKGKEYQFIKNYKEGFICFITNGYWRRTEKGISQLTIIR